MDNNWKCLKFVFASSLLLFTLATSVIIEIEPEDYPVIRIKIYNIHTGVYKEMMSPSLFGLKPGIYKHDDSG